MLNEWKRWSSSSSRRGKILSSNFHWNWQHLVTTAKQSNTTPATYYWGTEKPAHSLARSIAQLKLRTVQLCVYNLVSENENVSCCSRALSQISIWRCATWFFAYILIFQRASARGIHIIHSFTRRAQEYICINIFFLHRCCQQRRRRRFQQLFSSFSRDVLRLSLLISSFHQRDLCFTSG